MFKSNHSSVKNFIRQWSERGYEKGEAQTFWLQFLRDVLNISEPERYIKFEVPVKLKHTNFIDAFFPDTKVIVEQKSLDVNILPAYEQAKKYISGLPLSMHPKFIIVCNFQEFLIYDMETLLPPTKILLEELPEKFHVFDFLIDTDKTKINVELELSLQAGAIVGKLYDALLTQYINPNNEDSLQSLNKLCVRLIFCLFAESTGIFHKHKIFHDYLQNSRNIRQDLILLFDVLNTPINNRDPYLADDLNIFPYVNGGLFDGNIEIPNFTDDIKNLLLEEASSSFNWSGISPTIFGAVFESTLNPTTRRATGMHYTSIENIHKVIDPLFLDDLTSEFTNLRGKKNLLTFQSKLASLKFFDPACGSGNFLTESFICLRRLEKNPQQKADAVNIFGKTKLSNSIDYVGAWYHVASNLISSTNIKVAFVSTNSITQGEQVAPLWDKILNLYHCQIIFAYKTFRWDSESTQKAAVHCVIIAFADNSLSVIKKIFDGDNVKIVENISPYLIEGDNILIASRSKAIHEVPPMTHGNKPTDDGNFIFNEKEAAAFCKKYPNHAHLLHRYIGGKDFLHGKPVRFCLWLKDIPPDEFSNNKEIMRRLNNIKIFREKSSAAPTRKAAETPYKFFSTPQKHSNYLVLPEVSSERRQYIPIGFFTPDIIASDLLMIIPDATLFHFGVLTSSVHMAWVKTVAGRLESRYRYSAGVVYNNFIWCKPSEQQKRAIESTAQHILDVRKNYPNATLADLYGPLTMPKDLRDAHKTNDAAVLAAYGFDLKISEEEIVAALFKIYKNFLSESL